MKRFTFAVALVALGTVLGVAAVSRDTSSGFIVAQAPATAPATPATSAGKDAGKSQPDDPGFYAGEANLTPSERAGREIWYKATAGNSRFHTYVFQQRVNVLIDWYRVLNASERGDRFAAWGIINDPGCCVPGAKGCPATSLEQTYGFEWCPGDEELLSIRRQAGLSRSGLRLCRKRRSIRRIHTARPSDQRQSRVRSRLRHVDRRTGPTASSRTPASTRRAGSRSMAAWRAGRATRRSVEGPEVERRRAQPAGRRLDRAALPDRHRMRLVPHLLRSAESAQRTRPIRSGRTSRALVGNQYSRVSEILTPACRAHARGAADRACATRDRRHLGLPDGPGVQPRHDERDHQLARRPALSSESVNKWRKAASCADAGSRTAGASRGATTSAGSAAPRPRRSVTSSRAAKIRSARTRRSSASTSTSAPAPSSAGSIT